MVKIKARTKNGVITYKIGRSREAEIEQFHSGEYKGKFSVCYAFSKTSCAMCIKDTLEDAKKWVENLLTETYSYLTGENVDFYYL